MAAWQRTGVTGVPEDVESSLLRPNFGCVPFAGMPSRMFLGTRHDNSRISQESGKETAEPEPAGQSTTRQSPGNGAVGADRPRIVADRHSLIIRSGTDGRKMHTSVVCTSI